jgi:adenylosuccinate synthase
MTKLDVLNDFDTIKVCVGYRAEGKIFHQVPSNLEKLKHSEPVYEELEGWKTEIKGARNFRDLPPNARRYIRRIEALIHTRISMISVGGERDETVGVRNPFPKRGLKKK